MRRRMGRHGHEARFPLSSVLDCGKSVVKLLTAGSGFFVLECHIRCLVSGWLGSLRLLCQEDLGLWERKDLPIMDWGCFPLIWQVFPMFTGRNGHRFCTDPLAQGSAPICSGPAGIWHSFLAGSGPLCSSIHVFLLPCLVFIRDR